MRVDAGWGYYSSKTDQEIGDYMRAIRISAIHPEVDDQDVDEREVAHGAR